MSPFSEWCSTGSYETGAQATILTASLVYPPGYLPEPGGPLPFVFRRLAPTLATGLPYVTSTTKWLEIAPVPGGAAPGDWDDVIHFTGGPSTTTSSTTPVSIPEHL